MVHQHTGGRNIQRLNVSKFQEAWSIAYKKALRGFKNADPFQFRPFQPEEIYPAVDKVSGLPYIVGGNEFYREEIQEEPQSSEASGLEYYRIFVNPAKLLFTRMVISYWLTELQRFELTQLQSLVTENLDRFITTSFQSLDPLTAAIKDNSEMIKRSGGLTALRALIQENLPSVGIGESLRRDSIGKRALYFPEIISNKPEIIVVISFSNNQKAHIDTFYVCPVGAFQTHREVIHLDSESRQTQLIESLRKLIIERGLHLTYPLQSSCALGVESLDRRRRFKDTINELQIPIVSVDPHCQLRLTQSLLSLLGYATYTFENQIGSLAITLVSSNAEVDLAKNPLPFYILFHESVVTRQQRIATVFSKLETLWRRLIEQLDWRV
ncbi:MAG: hypothetical protein N2654_07770 [Deltaproteobacteria bacterium]|nr:hypothetical protein [Deltaproteobacteria bacterium]MCX7953506.1 hypothetical protein [Deltaproteobacteria bacterium]